MGNVFSRSKKQEYVYVHFNKKKFKVTLTAEDFNADKQVPLQQFRTKLAKVLNVPALSLTLYQQKPQKKLENMSATFKDYNIKNGADILALQEEQTQKAAPRTPFQQIEDILNEVNTSLGSRINQFVQQTPTNEKEREDEHRMLGETILARTIDLDNVEVEQPEERTKRKEAISKLQQLHKRIDEAKKQADTESAQPAQTEAVQTEAVQNEAVQNEAVQNETPVSAQSKVPAQAESAQPVQIETPVVSEPAQPVQTETPVVSKAPVVFEPVQKAPVSEPVQEALVSEPEVKSAPVESKIESSPVKPEEPVVPKEVETPEVTPKVEPETVKETPNVESAQETVKPVQETVKEASNVEPVQETVKPEVSNAEPEVKEEVKPSEAETPAPTGPSKSALKKKKNNKKKNKKR